MIRTVLFGLLLSGTAGIASAASITLDSDTELASKEFVIESGFDRLAYGTLNGDTQDVTFDPLFSQDTLKKPARFNIEGVYELSLNINLYECTKNCGWHIALATFAKTDSVNVGSICNRRDGSIAGTYQQYFFCRKAFRSFFAAQGTCWRQTINALRGWFDAAYALHIDSLKEGISFVARDREAEAFIRDSILACRDENYPDLTAGYYNGMFLELDKAKLQATQKVDRLLRAGDHDSARRWAEMIVADVGADVSIRKSISTAEVQYIEAILNRALQSDPPFVLP